jgi:hypothetical protein
VEYSFPEWLFVDRKVEFEWIRQYLNRWVRLMGKGPFGISLPAKRRIGKTAFLEKLVNEVLLDHPDVLPFPIFLREEYNLEYSEVLLHVFSWILSSIAFYETGELIRGGNPSSIIAQAVEKIEIK